MHTLHTVLHTFPSMPIRRTCATIQSFLSRCSLPKFSWPKCLIQERYCKEILDNRLHHDLLRGFRTQRLLVASSDNFFFTWTRTDLFWTALIGHYLFLPFARRCSVAERSLSLLRLAAWFPNTDISSCIFRYFFLPWWEPISFELLSFAILCFCHSSGAVQ